MTYETKEEFLAFVEEAGTVYAVDPVLQRNALNMLHAKKQGEFTAEDYDKLPEEISAELIDGVFYRHAAPTTVHQDIAGRLFLRFSNYILDKKGGCRVFISPVDVKLDCDEDTILHPDVLIVCDKSKIRREEIWGAPDLVLEVLSPGTRDRDLILKLYKYRRAGVREYWIVDPEKKKLYVYDFVGEQDLQVYELRGWVGVGIFGGELQIDLNEIRGLI